MVIQNNYVTLLFNMLVCMYIGHVASRSVFNEYLNVIHVKRAFDLYRTYASSISQYLFISTVGGVKCTCGGRKKSPRTSSLVQLSIRSGLSGSSNVSMCIQKTNTAKGDARRR